MLGATLVLYGMMLEPRMMTSHEFPSFNISIWIHHLGLFGAERHFSEESKSWI
jgi:hypothetical protein